MDTCDKCGCDSNDVFEVTKNPLKFDSPKVKICKYCYAAPASKIEDDRTALSVMFNILERKLLKSLE